MNTTNIIYKNLKKVLFIFFSLFLVYVGVFYYLIPAFAEQKGGSPESGADSRLKTASDSARILGYGSSNPGTWGDWGEGWNQVYSAAQNPFNDARADSTKNGTGAGSADCVTTFALNCYTKAKGGVDDYNNNGTIPSDTYKKTWTTCNTGNNYCGTGRSVAEKQDPNTGLTWSPRISSSSNWFTANNCKYPNGLTGDDGVCNTNGEVACYCIKHTGGADAKTGCEAYDDGNWRLPYQKELMLSYIDGSWGNLTSAGNVYWSGTTFSFNTQGAWSTSQNGGYTTIDAKTTNSSVRCVR